MNQKDENWIASEGWESQNKDINDEENVRIGTTDIINENNKKPFKINKLQQLKTTKLIKVIARITTT